MASNKTHKTGRAELIFFPLYPRSLTAVGLLELATGLVHLLTFPCYSYGSSFTNIVYGRIESLHTIQPTRMASIAYALRSILSFLFMENACHSQKFLTPANEQ